MNKVAIVHECGSSCRVFKIVYTFCDDQVLHFILSIVSRAAVADGTLELVLWRKRGIDN